jgi:hypothetical protein
LRYTKSTFVSPQKINGFMKKIFPLFAIASALLFTSCGSDDPQPANPLSGTMSADIDGSSWTASLAVQAVKAGGTLQVSGSDNSAKQLNVTIMNYTGSGTYTLGGPATSGNGSNGRWTAGLNSNQTYSSMVGQGEGTCTVTESGGNVEGTFQFTAKNTDGVQVNVTNGKFKSKI